MAELSDEAYIIENLFQIADKDGDDVNFTLNSVQRDLDATLSGRDLVPKARQEGVSSYFLARYTVACLMKRNTRAVVISHEQEATQRMLKKVRYYLENIRGPAPQIQNMSANEITFPKTSSMFYIGTAGSRKFGRGDTITHLHCSEYAYWPDPAGLMRGLLQAVPGSGEIAIESTGNGLNDYYRRCMRAYAGESRWKLHFYPWHTFPEYTLQLAPDEEEEFIGNLDRSLEEPQLLEMGISLPRLAWRRMKLEEMDYDLASFKQEYPMTLDECFQMSGQSVFHAVQYAPTAEWKEVERHLWILRGHPNPTYSYTMGADVAAGVGRDASVAQIVCLDTGDQVAEYVNNKIDPEQFGRVLSEIGGRFGNPYLVVESNNHGLLTLAVLEKAYPLSRLHRHPAPPGRGETARLSVLGHRTDKKSRDLAIGRLRSALAHDIIVHSPLLNSELSTFIEHENGKLAAQEGCNDDTVLALACAVVGMPNAAMYRASQVRSTNDRAKAKDPFLLDNIIKEMQSRGWNFPIKPQHRWN